MREPADLMNHSASHADGDAVSPALPSASVMADGKANNGLLLSAILGVYCLAVLIAFNETVSSIVAIWIRSETFAHGFLIVPLSLWLAWRMRDRFADLTVRPAPWALLLVAGAGTGWLFANSVDVLVVQQLALVSLLICGIWAIAGTAVVRCYAFPLGFLFLAVPMGENLIPPLMVFTADTTEFLVRATGVPIYREGMYLYLPTGTWSVIEACSGVRYLIASITLGLFYAHLTYHSLWRQAAFMVVAIILPILANSARAYVLVMVGHLSDMRYGIGADHLLFGWVFFGAVMLLMFWIGGFWIDDNQKAPVSDSGNTKAPVRAPARSLATVAVLAIVTAGIWHVVALSMNRNDNLINTVALTAPPAAAAWQAAEQADLLWRPAQSGADRELDLTYSAVADTAVDDQSFITRPTLVGLHLRQYLRQQQGAELVETVNPWRPDRNVWRLMDQQRMQTGSDITMQIEEALVTSAQGNMLIWSWYHIDERNTANPYLVKILEAKQQLLEGRREGTRVFVATPASDIRNEAREILRAFIDDHLPAIEATLASGISPAADATSHKESPVASEGIDR